MKRTILLAAATALLAWAFMARPTVPSTASTAGPYTCNGVTTDFAVPFPFGLATNLVVTKTDGVATSTLTYSTDYAVTGVNASSGRVILTSGANCGSGYTLTVKRQVPLTQPTSFRAQGTYAASTHEQAFDRQTMALQQLNRDKFGASEVQSELQSLFSGGPAVVPESWTITSTGASSYSLTGASLFVPELYVVTVGGAVQTPHIDYDVVSPGNLTFVSAPTAGLAIKVRAFGYARAVNQLATTDVGAGLVTATGSTAPRSLAARAADVVNVRDWGATGNGTSDDAQALVDANLASSADDRSVYFPAGTYKLVSSEPVMGYGTVRWTGGTFFRDVNTNERFQPVFTSRRPHLRQAWQDRNERTVRSFAPKIVCYGDSNTRYYQGDTSTSGPYSKSYCAQLDVLLGQHPSLWASTVQISGFPGMDAQWAIDNWNGYLGGASVVVLGFGTNDVKVAGADLEAYIGRMRTLVRMGLDSGIVPIVLGIPWFVDTYGSDGVLSQQRIAVWNNRLKALCDEYRVEFIDTYSPFKDSPGSWFNEAVTQRHFNADASHVIAKQVLAALLRVTTLGNAVDRPRLWREQFSLAGMPELVAGSPTILARANGGRVHQILRITAGNSITLKASGRWVVGFYPAGNATGTIVASYGPTTTNVSITAATDAGETYPVARYAAAATFSSVNYDLTITSTGGNLDIRYYGFEFPGDTGASGSFTELAAASLPASPVPGRLYLVTELAKPVLWVGAAWTDLSGWVSVGNTAARTAVQSDVPKGFRFYDTQTVARYKSDGAGGWAAF